MLLEPEGTVTDIWTAIGDEPIPHIGPVIVPLDRLDEALSLRPAVGVAIPNDTDAATLMPVLPRLGLIQIGFPGWFMCPRLCPC